MRWLFLLATLISSLAFGQGTRSIAFPDSGDRKVWSAASANEAPNTANMLLGKDPTAVWEPAPGDQLICVLDTKSGNLATHPVADTNPWKVIPAEFNLVGEIRVRVQQGGKPLEAASVSLNKGMAKVIDPSAKGEVSFYGISPGHVRIDVAYKLDGKDRTLNQQTDLSLTRSDAIPTIICDIGGAAPVSGSTTPAPPNGSKMPPPVVVPKPAGGGIIGALIMVMVAAAIALGVLFFGLKWIYANQEKTKDALAKVGVTVPDPVVPDPDPVAAPPFVSSPVQSQIVLSGGDPVGSMPVASPMTNPGGGGARLVGVAGAFDLVEGVNAVGREAGLTISLVGESTVSRRHAEVVRQGSQLVVRDGGSTNGTFVNGQRIAGEMVLHPGDSVQFGSVAFRVEG